MQAFLSMKSHPKKPEKKKAAQLHAKARQLTVTRGFSQVLNEG
ncbi:hypothetical protein [Desulfovibrio sp. MES5]|nr:hypothetical protein [Desulfovibrio sp. MES5]